MKKREKESDVRITYRIFEFDFSFTEFDFSFTSTGEIMSKNLYLLCAYHFTTSVNPIIHFTVGELYELSKKIKLMEIKYV